MWSAELCVRYQVASMTMRPILPFAFPASTLNNQPIRDNSIAFPGLPGNLK
jgi:hypothetical protein